MLLDVFKNAFYAVTLNKLRSFLTVLGIIIGVASVNVIVAIMSGFSSSIEETFEGFGSTSLTISAKSSFEHRLKGINPKITSHDLNSIKRQISGIENIIPLIQLYQFRQVKYDSQFAETQVFGTTSHYQDVYSTFVSEGRFLTPQDNHNVNSVVVVGTKLLENLKLGKNPIGQKIQLGNHWFEIIGVFEEKGSIFGISKDDMAVIPFNTGKSLVGDLHSPDFTINLNVIRVAEIDLVKSKIKNILRKNHNLRKVDPDDFEIESSDQIMESFKEITTTLTAVLAGIVGIALLVGGIGVMNIMLVSVTERTKEIGVDKALGATRRFIVLQFLLESVILACIGGVFGVVLSMLIIELISYIPLFPEPFLPIWAIFLSLTFSSIIGVIFGFAPALKASKLDPINALNYE